MTDVAAPLRPNATTLRWAAAPLLYGIGATAEIGIELGDLGARRVGIVTDDNVLATGVPEQVGAYIGQAGIEVEIWSGGQTEPTETSVQLGAAELADRDLDAYVALGGGSCIDTCKAIALLDRHPGALIDYVAAPHGGGRRIAGPIAPIVAVPTLFGAGSEASGAAALEVTGLDSKASIVDPALRPVLAIVDPLNSVGAPPAPTAAAGYDTLVQSIESYTSRPFDRVPAGTADRRSPMVGANPISDVWTERAIELCGRFFARTVHNGYDVEARVGMAQAATFSRLGTAGAHIPHANATALAALVRDYRPAGFAGLGDRTLLPHGQAVVATAPAAFAFTFAGAPERHTRAAELLGVAPEAAREEREEALPRLISRLVEETGGPVDLEALGFGADDVAPLAARAARQARLLPRSPRPVEVGDLAEIFRRSLRRPGR